MKKIIFCLAASFSALGFQSVASACGVYIYVCVATDDNGNCTAWQVSCAEQGGGVPGTDSVPPPAVFDKIPSETRQFELFLKDGKVSKINVLK